MSGTVAERKRLLTVTAGNLRNAHLYVSQHLDFFPADIVGPPKLNGPLDGRAIRLRLEGLNETIETDIGSDATSGKPRRMFRRRTWVRRFFQHHRLSEGDMLALERRGKRDYRLYPFGVRRARSEDGDDWRDESSPAGDEPTVLELFAGCGGMALGFKQAGFRTVLANEWDASTALA